MKRFRILLKSAFFLALFYFYCLDLAGAYPLTQNIYKLREGEVESTLTIKKMTLHNEQLKECLKIGVGLVSSVSLFLDVGMLQYYDNADLSKNTISDTSLLLIYHCGSIVEKIPMGLLIELGFGTGPYSMENPQMYPTELGFSTLSAGLYTGYLSEYFHFIVNIFYTMMPQDNSSIYDGITFNFADKETWKMFFGLNPLKEQSMLYYKKFNNDILHIALTLSSQIMYPFVFYLSAESGNRINRKSQKGRGDYPVLFKGYNDTRFLVIAVGSRFFFNEKTYLGIGYLYNCMRDYDYSLKYGYSLEVSSLW